MRLLAGEADTDLALFSEFQGIADQIMRDLLYASEISPHVLRAIRPVIDFIAELTAGGFISPDLLKILSQFFQVTDLIQTFELISPERGKIQ